MTDMKPAKSAWPSRAGIAAALLVLLWFAMLTIGAGPVDGRLLALVYAGDRPVLAAVAKALTMTGEGPVLILVTVAAAAAQLWLGHPRRGFAVVLVPLVGRLLVDIQKYSILRFRPENEVHLVPVSTPSFPSGHSANSMIVWLVLAIVFFGDTRWRVPAIAAAATFALLVGSSRVVLGVHYPTDVLGGWAFGLLWVILAMPLADRLIDSRR